MQSPLEPAPTGTPLQPRPALLPRRPLASLLSIAAGALLLAALGGCPHAGTGQRGERPLPSEPIRLTIVGTNDLHGWVQPHSAKLADGSTLRAGGASLLSSYLKALRASNPGGVVLVDAGDLFQGTLVANLSEGQAVIAAYNALGYDAAAIGNHEFDYGPVGPRALALDPADDPLGALGACAAKASFPLLARNVRLADGRRPQLLGSSTIVERHGLKIGIVGLLTPLTPQVTNPVNVMRLRFGALAEEAIAGAAELRAQGADVVVALVHAGGRCSRFDDPRSLESCDSREEGFQLLQALPAGLFDVVVAAHTHARIGHFVNGMPVIESGSYGQQFGLVELTIDPATRRPDPTKTRIASGIPICERFVAGTESCNLKGLGPDAKLVEARFEGRAIESDPAIEKLLAPYFEAVEHRQSQPLGVTVPAALTREYHAESPLGNALADVLRAMEGADVALLNSGGLRSDLAPGPLSFGALFEVFPFDNGIATLTLTGQEIVELFEALLSSNHGAPQTSGLRFTVERCGPKAAITSIAFADGKPFDRKASYKLVTSDFLALGGDGVGKVLDRVEASRKDVGHRRDLGMREAMAEWLSRKGGTLEGRIDGRMEIVTPDRPDCPKPRE